ncbi:hypothetical protein OEG79_06380 [Pseudomonas sp. Z8(2022)]|jgi:hypothetical protein|uniref:Uncharacterized protein n=1 Tax=Ectopseudomonas mendocina TaxID=300 RepID=A0A379ISE1_ECTME|nr:MULTISPECIES: hypothetical protein [Pseudomonas]UYP31720.1 hypothetical protein OEG79_06380 [Pseudomonas sp. Z8(2022)]SUD39228.1 Uncharacterised protein [Pseudomonas mendocina]
MPGIIHVADTFAAFLDDLQTRRAPALYQLSKLRNGFEGWLKIELYLWLTERYQLQPQTDVGVEYKVWLDQRRGQMDRETKQCDLWVRDAAGHGYHYIELKVPFANNNRGKLFLSASDDFWYMSRLLAVDQSAASGSAILVGAGFDEHDWTRAIDEAVAYAGNDPAMVQLRVGSLKLEEAPTLQWAVMTKRYAPRPGA